MWSRIVLLSLIPVGLTSRVRLSEVAGVDDEEMSDCFTLCKQIGAGPPVGIVNGRCQCSQRALPKLGLPSCDDSCKHSALGPAVLGSTYPNCKCYSAQIGPPMKHHVSPKPQPISGLPKVPGSIMGGRLAGGAPGAPRPACTAQRQPEGGAPDGRYVVAIGDSLTEGKDVPCPGYIPDSCLWMTCPGVTKQTAAASKCPGKNDPWPSQLQRKISGYRVLNRGCYGQTVDQMMARLDGELAPEIRSQIAVVTVMAGTNNLWDHVGDSVDTVKRKLQQLHAGIKERVPAAKLVVMTVPQGGAGMGAGKAKVEEVNRWLKATYSNNQAQGLYFVDTHKIQYDGMDRNGHPLMYDNTHFGPEGYGQIAQLVATSGAF